MEVDCPGYLYAASGAVYYLSDSLFARVDSWRRVNVIATMHLSKDTSFPHCVRDMSQRLPDDSC